MKLNSTVLLTLILLALMLGAGSVSAILGFDIGSQALKGVTTPDARPTTKFASTSNNPQAGVSFLREEEILKTVKSRIEGKTKAAKTEKLENNEDDELVAKKEETTEKSPEPEEKPDPGFPIQTEADGVSLSVQSARFSGGNLIMRVKMQNKSQEPVRFLYSFLDVTDENGLALSASTDGLPTELSANSSESSGTISIPASLLNDVNKVSLALTDYPAQKLRLELSNIPISR